MKLYLYYNIIVWISHNGSARDVPLLVLWFQDFKKGWVKDATCVQNSRHVGHL